MKRVGYALLVKNRRYKLKHNNLFPPSPRCQPALGKFAGSSWCMNLRDYEIGVTKSGGGRRAGFGLVVSRVWSSGFLMYTGTHSRTNGLPRSKVFPHFGNTSLRGSGPPLRERAGSLNHFEPAHSAGAGPHSVNAQVLLIIRTCVLCGGGPPLRERAGSIIIPNLRTSRGRACVTNRNPMDRNYALTTKNHQKSL
jgi:hypothetical protein